VTRGTPAITILLVVTMALTFPFASTRAAVGEKAAGQIDPAERYSVRFDPKAAQPGDLVKVEIRGPDAAQAEVEGSLGDQELIFHPGGKGQVNFSLAGIDLERKPGWIPVTVRIHNRDGKGGIVRDSLRVLDKTFSVQRLQIKEKPYTPRRLERIHAERERLDSIWAQTTPDRIWRGTFIPPLHRMTVTSAFGLRRFINGTPRQPHTGVDLRAAMGDTVFTTNRGKVALTGGLYFSGNTIVIDHGEGLYSMYFHLSGELVREGDTVERGQPIGLVGSTGRATGPHLHWGIVLRGARLDPLKILDLRI